jgi:hypothetical protein
VLLSSGGSNIPNANAHASHDIVLRRSVESLFGYMLKEETYVSKKKKSIY